MILGVGREATSGTSGAKSVCWGSVTTAAHQNPGRSVDTQGFATGLVRGCPCGRWIGSATGAAATICFLLSTPVR